MKNLKIKKRITDYFNRKKWQILIVFASLFAGIIIGSFFSARMSNQNSDALTKYIQNFTSAFGLQSVNNKEIFTFSVYNNIKLVLFLWISGLWVGLLPLGIVQIGLKGYKIGFSTVLFIKSFGTFGTLLSSVAILPQILIFLPSILVYMVFNINFATSLKNRHISANAKSKLYLKNLIGFLVMIIMSVLSGLADAYIIPALLKPVCYILNR